MNIKFYFYKISSVTKNLPLNHSGNLRELSFNITDVRRQTDNSASNKSKFYWAKSIAVDFVAVRGVGGRKIA